MDDCAMAERNPREERLILSFADRKLISKIKKGLPKFQ